MTDIDFFAYCEVCHIFHLMRQPILERVTGIHLRILVQQQEVFEVTELTVGLGVGVGDLQLAASREVQRIMREAGGDQGKAVQLALEKIHKLGIISESELSSLSKVCELGFESAAGNMAPERAYVEVRRIYDEMLAGGQASPTALALASASAGSYVSVEEVGRESTVVFKKASTTWTERLGLIGALIGDRFGAGALGAAIGGAAGKVVDDCLA